MRAPLAAVTLGLVLFGASCNKAEPIPPADPQGKDLVKGAIIAAVEKSGGIRVYKMIHVDDYPMPIGHEFHMIAYDPKAPTYEEARKLHQQKALTVALQNVWVRKVLFMNRDHRVIGKEPVTPEEETAFKKSRRTR
jgi:hypothetical protein